MRGGCLFQSVFILLKKKKKTAKENFKCPNCEQPPRAQAFLDILKMGPSLQMGGLFEAQCGKYEPQSQPS